MYTRRRLSDLGALALFALFVGAHAQEPAFRVKKRRASKRSVVFRQDSAGQRVALFDEAQDSPVDDTPDLTLLAASSGSAIIHPASGPIGPTGKNPAGLPKVSHIGHWVGTKDIFV
jgi:hypothetical protein